MLPKQGVQQPQSPEELCKALGVDPYFTETMDTSALGEVPLQCLEGRWVLSPGLHF